MMKSPYARYTPAAGNVFRADMKAARMARVRPNSRVPFTRRGRGLSGLSATWMDTISNIATGAIGIGTAALADKRARAAARLQAAQRQEELRVKGEGFPLPSSPLPAFPSSPFPILPLVIGAAVIGGGLLLLKRK